MISTHNVSLRYGDRALFEDVSVKFTDGNCYGIIGANGAGKSTFLKILSGEIEPNKGEVIIEPNKRLSVLKQDHFAYDDNKVVETVIMGNKRLFEIMQEKEKLYAKPDFNDEDGIKLGELEGEFADMDGWNAESDAEIMLNGLGITTEYHDMYMRDLDGNQKVEVLLAQALFGNPDILLLDEPTNHLDLKSIRWLENFLLNFKNTVIVVSHDRYFLNKVCTHIADIDYSRIQLYVGNYDFWYEYSQMQIQQMKDQNKKAEAKKKEEARKQAEKHAAQASSKYDQDVRVRTGAYRIIGVSEVVTAREGQTIKSLSQKYLGPGMECYVEALNGTSLLKSGQKVKIPKLELKKKK